MPIKYAVAAGSIDDPTRWDGGTLPAPGDDVFLGGFAMTAGAGADINWNSLSNAANVSPAIPAGGTLTINGARNFSITAMVPRTDAATTNGMIQITAATGTVSITGEARAGGTGSTSHCINRTGNCNFVFNGSLTAITGSAGYVINLAGTGSVVMGSSGTPITLPVALTPLIQLNNASLDANIYASQFAGGASGNSLVITLGRNINTFGPCFGGPASARTGITSGSIAGLNHVHVGDCYAGTGGSTPAGIQKGVNGSLTVRGKLISSTTYFVGNAVAVTGGTFILNDDTPRDIELGPVTPLVFSSTISTCTMFVNAIVRVTQSNVAAINGGFNGSLTVTQEIAGGSAGSAAHAISLAGSCILNALGGIRGGSVANCPGIACAATTGTQTINGNSVGGPFMNAHGINVNGTSTVIINGKVTGNDYGVGSTVTGGSCGVSVVNLATVFVREVESGPRGQSGINGPVLMLPSPLNKSTYRQTVNGATTELIPTSGGGIQSYGFMS